jgi:hypothetical protein
MDHACESERGGYGEIADSPKEETTVICTHEGGTEEDGESACNEAH